MPYAANQFQPVYSYKTAHPPGKDVYQGPIPDSHLIRFYLPPSTKGTFSLALFCEQKTTVGVIARLGRPPMCNCEAYKTSEISDNYYLSLPWDRDAGALFQLRSRDWRVRNGSGTIGIVKDYQGSSKGEWLFLQILFRGNRPGLVQPGADGCSLICHVDGPLYEQWYHSVPFDASGNPPLVTYDLLQGDCNFKSSVIDTGPAEPDPGVQPVPGGGSIFGDLLKPKPEPDPVPTPVEPIQPPDVPVVEDPAPKPTPTPGPEIDPLSGWPIIGEMEIAKGGLLYFGNPKADGTWNGFAIRMK